jgi:hypothetical protein
VTHEWIVRTVLHRRYLVSHHADQERMNDRLSIQEIETAMVNGRVLESYPDTGRGESVLIAGFADSGTPVHVVYGKRGESGVIVTVYIPGPPRFVDPFQRSD